jgi:hypothetical protein
MAVNDRKDIEEKDSHFPYAELDNHSKKLRQYAFELAESLSDIEPRTNEINLVIQALSKVNTDDIKMMDRALNNFKKALAGMVMRSNENSIFGPNVRKHKCQY